MQNQGPASVGYPYASGMFCVFHPYCIRHYRCRAGKGQCSGSSWHGTKARSAAVPRPPSPREGALQRVPAEIRGKKWNHKAHRTSGGAPARGSARHYGAIADGVFGRVRDFTHHWVQGVGGRTGSCECAPYRALAQSLGAKRRRPSPPHRHPFGHDAQHLEHQRHSQPCRAARRIEGWGDFNQIGPHHIHPAQAARDL